MGLHYPIICLVTVLLAQLSGGAQFPLPDKKGLILPGSDYPCY